jgi:hypothetical protein
MVMAQIPALFLPIGSINGKKTSLKKSTSKKVSNNYRSVHEQKKNDAQKCAYLLRAAEKRTNVKRTK